MEVRKIKSSRERVRAEREHKDDIIHTVLFTAGAALLMAYLKRAWVFLVLNLVLLAIIFRSLRSASTENQEICNDLVEMEIERKKNRRRCMRSAQPEEVQEDCHKVYGKRSGGIEPVRVDHDHDHAGEVPIRLSKEELNERVETFIAMFRQHLVSDAKNGRSQFFVKPERAKNIFNFQNVSYKTLSPRGSVA